MSLRSARRLAEQPPEMCRIKLRLINIWRQSPERGNLKCIDLVNMKRDNSHQSIPVKSHASGRSKIADLTNLSAREIEILAHLASGYSNEEVADLLYISVHTVKSHRKAILRKSGARNMLQLVSECIRSGLI